MKVLIMKETWTLIITPAKTDLQEKLTFVSIFFFFFKCCCIDRAVVGEGHVVKAERIAFSMGGQL